MIEIGVTAAGLSLSGNGPARLVREPADVLAFGGRPDRAYGRPGEIEWLGLQPCSFAGVPCAASLLFRWRRLVSVTLVQLSPSPGWPTDERSQAEIASWRSALQRHFRRRFRTEEERFAWGAIWLGPDAKAGFACVVLTLKSGR